MRRPLIGLTLLGLSACATILGGGSSQSVSLTATPPGAQFTVRSSSGLQMASGAAPQTVRLPRKNEYQIDFIAPGYQPQTIALTKGTNGWVFGNLVIGWIVGFVVDFASGSAYKLEPALVNVSMVSKVAANGTTETDALVSLYDRKGRLIRELSAPMVPVALAPAAP